MKLLDLHIDGFGKFHNQDVTFSDGLNIVYGKNEAGKSTLHTFIRCMLFGLERGRGRASRNDLYSRFFPWDRGVSYGGRLRVKQGNTVYRIERCFQKERKSLVVINETAGREVDPNQAFWDKLLCGLTETTYLNTISIGQLKSATDDGMVGELRNYIANMNTSGNMALNITKASAYLQNRRREFERQLDPEAARNYTSLISEIRAIEKEISAPEYENQLRSYQNMRGQVRDLIAEKQEARESLLQRIATGRQVLDSAQFTDQASITTYQENATAMYQNYLVQQAASQKKLRPICCALCAFLAAAFAVLGILFGIQLKPLIAAIASLSAPRVISPMLLAGGCAMIGVAFAVISIVLALMGRNNRRDLAYSTRILQEIFSRHLGDPTISPEAMDAFEARMAEYIRLSQVLDRSQASLAEQAAEISSLQERENNCEDIIARQQRTQWELEKKLEHLSACKDQAELLKQVLSENERIREEITAIDLALETMSDLSSSIRDSFGLYLNKTASDMICEITGGIYDSMSVDENLNVFMNTPTKLVPISQVSSGTMDQIYLALRLAAAKLVQTGHDKMPFIFDDSFVLYDDERLRSALTWLSKAHFGQAIIFTCHRREAQMLTSAQQPYHLIQI